jgi:hypothetical protein
VIGVDRVLRDRLGPSFQVYRVQASFSWFVVAESEAGGQHNLQFLMSVAPDGVNPHHLSAFGVCGEPLDGLFPAL